MMPLREDECAAMRLELELVARELADIESTASHLRRRIAALIAEQPEPSQSSVSYELGTEAAEPSALVEDLPTFELEPSFENTTITLVIVSRAAAIEEVAAPVTDTTSKVVNITDLIEEPAPNSDEADVGKVLLFPLAAESSAELPADAVAAADIAPPPVEPGKTNAHLGMAAAALAGLSLLGLHFEFREVGAVPSASPIIAQILKPIAALLPR